MSMIHEITAAAPRNKRPMRKGRGEGSGKGKTAGRGGKGSSARAGSPHWKPGHEGGQTPIHRRMPKRGFSNDDFARNWYIVNVADLGSFDDGATVDPAALEEKGLIPDQKLPVKILGNGELSKRLTIVAGWYSHGAFDKISQAGGSAQDPKGQKFEFPKPKKKFIPRETKKPGKKGAAEGEPAADAAAATAKASEKPAKAPEAPAAPAGELPASAE